MAVKVDFSGIIKDLKKVEERFYKILEAKIEEEVKSLIGKGLSPVKGQGRYKKYSKSYVKQMGKGKLKDKKPRPVNLKATGNLYKAFVVKNKGDRLVVSLDERKAPYAKFVHELRKILPTEKGDKFTRALNTILRESLREAVRQVL